MASATAVTPVKRSARERLLGAADELFYEGGIHSVGIDRVIERAGVAKASLYDTFGSKEALIQAYLEARHAARKARITARIAGYATPREQLLGVFDAMRELMAEPRFRGCAFNRAAAESRLGGGVQAVCDEARGWIRNLFADLARQAGAQHPEVLARQLMLLYDGASVGAQMEGGTAAASVARQAAQVMLDADIVTPAAVTGRRRAPTSKAR